MNEEIFGRTYPLMGHRAMECIHRSKVCIFGLGGVGSYAFEALVRAGIGKFVIVDHAKVDITNLNRQLIALHSTLGEYKTEAAAARARDINPEVEITCRNLFLDKGNVSECIPEDTDYLVDAIDTVSSKILLVEYASSESIPIISCMGTGNKIHPEMLKIGGLAGTSVDPLARVMRTELKKRGITELEVVWSDESPLVKGDGLPLNKEGRKVPASTSYVPSCAGLMMASAVINRIAGKA